MIPITGTAPDNADQQGESLPNVVLIGAAGFDIKGRVLGDRVFEGSSNTGMLTMGMGGSARNIAENLARLDGPTTLITAVADDMLGELIIERTRAAGVATDRVLRIPDERTGAYLGIITPVGDLL